MCSLVGELELSRLLKHIGSQHEKFKSFMKYFRFADTVYESLGKIVFPLAPLRHVELIPVKLDIVKVNVPALLGLDAMDANYLQHTSLQIHW